ncbi:hypothetical protein MPL1_11023 [Methylophaga lonarensis MPL]|uniref:Uncharacterized protein n=1 Tax=Methylophaga lonarensis MPL TaxID=1286106 RepID=M7PEK0_9GAMM|nr:hypothetical protein MPL1_11023 [Methylophaga lonarensis MPL]
MHQARYHPNQQKAQDQIAKKLQIPYKYQIVKNEIRLNQGFSLATFVNDFLQLSVITPTATAQHHQAA